MPSTFQMPEALEDEATIDEMQELIDDENAEPADHPTEPDCNEFGVFVRNVEMIAVPMKKSWKCAASVLVAKAACGNWYVGYDYKTDNASMGGGFASLSGRAFRSKKEAVIQTLDQLRTAFEKAECPKGVKAINQVCDEVHGWEEEVTVPPHDAETQEAIENARSAGLEVGEPAAAVVGGEAPASDQAVADFKASLHAAFGEVATTQLALREAEKLFKECKAEAKAAVEILQKLSSRGPERMPLFDSPKASKSVEVAQPQPPAPRFSDAWKHAPLAELGLPKGLADKLEGDGITTIGRLEQRRADVCNKREKWPKGVGKAAIDKIEDAMLEWLAENQDTWQPPAEAASTEPGSDDDQ